MTAPAWIEAMAYIICKPTDAGIVEDPTEWPGLFTRVEDASGGALRDDTVRNGPGCLFRTTAHDLGHRDSSTGYSTGFRCCAD